MSSVPRFIPHYAVNDYLNWEGDWELIDGVPVAMTPSPFGPHERIVSQLAYQIQSQIVAKDRDCEIYTNLDWVVTEDTVIRPDIMVVCGEQPMEHLHRRPTMMVEVLSDSTRSTDLGAKLSIIREQGVNTYLAIEPDEKTIRELVNQPNAEVSTAGELTIDLDDDCQIDIRGSGLFDKPS